MMMHYEGVKEMEMMVCDASLVESGTLTLLADPRSLISTLGGQCSLTSSMGTFMRWLLPFIRLWLRSLLGSTTLSESTPERDSKEWISSVASCSTCSSSTFCTCIPWLAQALLAQSPHSPLLLTK